MQVTAQFALTVICVAKGNGLVTNVYGLTKAFPRDEIYGLTSQTRRAVASVPANIAEGQGRRLSDEQHQAIQKDLNEVGRLLNGLMRSIKKRSGI